MNKAILIHMKNFRFELLLKPTDEAYNFVLELFHDESRRYVSRKVALHKDCEMILKTEVSEMIGELRKLTSQ